MTTILNNILYTHR